LAGAGRRTAERIVVAGGGVAGLSAALALAAAGRRVTLCEAQPRIGGKARRLPSPAGPVNGGPTVFTMRGVFEELFAAAGARLEDHVTLHAEAVLARHAWSDGSTLDLFADPARSEAAVAEFAGPRAADELRAWTARARLLFEAFEGPVMRNPRPTPFGVALAAARDGRRLLPAIAPLSTLWGATDRAFSDPRLKQLFARYATYVGGSPYLSPAILALIWRAEAAGVWRVKGGMAALAEALGALAAERGAEIRTGAPVAEIELAGGRVSGVRLADGERLPAEAVVFNGDPGALGAGLLGPAVRGAAPALERAKRSLSAWVWTFAAAPEGFGLEHHTVFFGEDYRAEFADIFERRHTPRSPTLYLCAQDRGAGLPPPSGPERLMMILNAPADGDGPPPDREEIEACQTRVFERLRRMGLRLAEPDPATALTTPWDFAKLFPGTGGAIYGAAPHGSFATFRRPMTRTRAPGLYLAGGGAHPGPGVAMSCLSGRLAAEAIMTDPVST
jgi:1-hydroxycarotenoid 3,4-desaturase